MRQTGFHDGIVHPSQYVLFPPDTCNQASFHPCSSHNMDKHLRSRMALKSPATMHSWVVGCKSLTNVARIGTEAHCSTPVMSQPKCVQTNHGDWGVSTAIAALGSRDRLYPLPVGNWTDSTLTGSSRDKIAFPYEPDVSGYCGHPIIDGTYVTCISVRLARMAGWSWSGNSTVLQWSSCNATKSGFSVLMIV